ncbi:hypothetical protein CGZ94_04295 [Enemella evansiae]|uniref:Nuclease SbcCD subunit C n=1 Tax=Enemella evansiae TaxID=2016499 RepID=A0A255GKR2_9ACTN|nr:ATP-binding protein [Enemella evansiae]OYO16409.1 hypothetical protein CGZ94_04295 [Enemella evansiae]
MSVDPGTDLRQWVTDHLQDADESAAALVQAAFDGPDAIRQALSGDSPTPSAPPPRDDLPAVWLKRLTVEGFRGVGGAVHLTLDAIPGLTVISGRNGSGKSSLAEALEVALTGKTHRWGDHRLNTQFDPEWRNLHTDAEPAISLTLTEDAGEDFSIDVAWAENETDKSRSTSTVLRAGQMGDLTQLGWENALTVFRPLLSYEELGQSLLQANQRATASAFERGLGLQRLTAASEALRGVSKEVKGAAGLEKERRDTLRTCLEQSEDERAVPLLAALPKRSTPNIDMGPFAAAAVVRDGPGGTAVLDRIAEMSVPNGDQVRLAAARLRQAAEGSRAVHSADDELDQRRRRLLELAMELHDPQGVEECPVCRVGTLDADWRAQTAAVLQQTSEQQRAVATADQELAAAWAGLRRLVGSTPPELRQDSVPLSNQAAASAAWSSWAVLPNDPARAADHAEQGLVEVTRSTGAWQTEALAEAERRRDEWQPVAEALIAWVSAFRDYRTEYERGKRLAAAEGLMKQVMAAAREHQIGPIRQRAQEMWKMLRHESNVDLGDLKLSAQKLEIPAEVDGVQAGALRVMSQGELHALALALFLPRVATDASPFRFVVLDDPVQAMDPAKVEGLLDVLLSLARTRQVVVFSHDDRLAAAARRRMLSSAATIKLIQVERGARSRVTVRGAEDPARVYVAEAGALLKDRRLPDRLKERVAGGLFRMAIEAAARDRWFILGRKVGLGRIEVEQRWDARRTTADRVALALGMDDCFAWYDTGPHRRRAITAANRGQHEALAASRLEDLRRDVESTVDDLRARDA